MDCKGIIGKVPVKDGGITSAVSVDNILILTAGQRVVAVTTNQGIAVGSTRDSIVTRTAIYQRAFDF